MQILAQFLSDEKETGHHKLFMSMLNHKRSLFSTNPVPRAHRSKKLRLAFYPYTHTHTLQLFPATGVNRGHKLSAAAYIESIKGSYLSTVNLSVIYLQRKGVSYWPIFCVMFRGSPSVKQREVALCVTYQGFFLC